MSFTVIIPARYASSRLPGKPLMDIAGKPMIQHVYERAQESNADRVIVATDDERIFQACKQFGASVYMTGENHPSGTDRIYEVVGQLNCTDDEVIVNVQGDEPLIPAGVINQVADNLNQHPLAGMATLCDSINHIDQVFDPNAVKVITDSHGYALYFSRAAIPWCRDAFAKSKNYLPDSNSFYRHIGIYAYRAEVLKNYVSWPQCELEKQESLEQLRALWHGIKIHVDVIQEKLPGGVDTVEDLQKVRQLLSGS